MRIAAIYIFANSLPHIFGENHQEMTLNLGGMFLYKINETANSSLVISEEKENKEFINGFWSDNIQNISAIVGANGSGKSTILHQLKDGGFKLVCELDSGKSRILWPYEIGRFIYYTPFLNETREENDPSYTHNLSKLALFKKDTSNEPLNLNSHWELHKSEHIKRIIRFVNSNIFSEELQNLKIPSFQQIKVRILKIHKDDWDSSRNFQPFFTAFEKLKDKEREREEEKLLREFGLKTKEDIDKHKDYNRLSRKVRLKLEILDGVIKKIHSILESSGNKYLEEGFIANGIHASDPEFVEIDNLKNALYWFLDSAFIKIYSDEFFLPKQEIKELIELLLECAEKDNNIENWTVLTVNFEDCYKIIEAYEKFLLSFKGKFSYDKAAMLTFEPDVRLSTGEMSMYELFSVLFDLKYRLENNLVESIPSDTNLENFENYTILLDEADLGFHPMWKRMFVKSLVKIIPKIFPHKNINLILTTHSPLSLSDIPSNSMVLLSKDVNSGNTLLAGNDNSRMKSFGANINDLLANSFFLEDYLIGDFAKEKIEEVIDWINNNKGIEQYNNEEYEKMQKIISLIEEPVLRNKLVEMLSEIEINEDFINEMIDKEIAYLRNILRGAND